MNEDKQVNPAVIAGGGAALLTVLMLHKKRKAKKAAKRALKIETARAKLDAAAEMIEAAKPKKAAKYATRIDAARAKLDAAGQKLEAKKPKKAKAEKKAREKKVKEKKAPKEKPLALTMEITEKKAPRPSDNLLRDLVLISGRYKLKSKKKRTKPLALIILLYLVEQIYREWERDAEPVAEDGSEPKKGKHKK